MGVEMRKLLQRVPARILLLVLFLTNGFLAWNRQLPGTELYDRINGRHILSLYEALPEDGAQALDALQRQNDVIFDALIEEGASSELLTVDLYTERRLFSRVTERVEEAVRYEAILKEIDENAQTLLLTGRYGVSTFGYRNILKSQEQYRALEGVQPRVFYSGAIELLPGERITDGILLLFCLFLGLELICTERQSGAMALLKPTYRGYYPLIRKKIVAGVVLTFLGTGILYGTNLMIGLIRCGGVPMDAPVQSVFGFVRSPWKISISAYVLGFFCMKFLWASMVTAMVYLACCIGKTVLGSCSIFLLLCAPSLVMPRAVWSLVASGDTVKLFSEYRNLNVFGWPVNSFLVCVLVMTALCVLCFALACRIHVMASPIVFGRKEKSGRKLGAVSTNLLFYEARKLLLLKGGIWVLLGFLTIQTAAYWDMDAFIRTQERQYMQYSETLSGTANSEKDTFLEEETERFASLYAQLEEYTHSFSGGEMNQEAYEALSAGIMRQLEEEEAFLRAKNQYEQMKAEGYDYVCQSGYERLLGVEGKRDALGLSVKLMICLILGLSSIHSVESECHMTLLLNSVPRKRDSRKRKTILASVYAVAAAMIAFVPQICFIAKKYGLSGMWSHGNSVPLLQMGTQTILGVLCIYGIIILALTVGFAQLIALLSKKTGSTTATILLSLVWIPVFLGVLI